MTTNNTKMTRTENHNHNHTNATTVTTFDNNHDDHSSWESNNNSNNNDGSNHNHPSTLIDTAVTMINQEQVDTANREFSSCLLRQYMFCTSSVIGSTGYTIYNKIPNQFGILIMAGATGSVLDLMYGWFYACTNEKQHYYHITKQFQLQQQQQQIQTQQQVQQSKQQNEQQQRI